MDNSGVCQGEFVIQLIPLLSPKGGLSIAHRSTCHALQVNQSVWFQVLLTKTSIVELIDMQSQKTNQP